MIEILEQYNTSQAGDCLGTFFAVRHITRFGRDFSQLSYFSEIHLIVYFLLKNTTFSGKILYCCTSNRFFQYSVIRCL